MADPIIKSKQVQKEVNGILTDVVCTQFSNYIFVVLTQYGKIGTLISVTPDSRSNDISTPTFSTKVLLGKDEVCTMKLFRLILCQCNYTLLSHGVTHFMWWKGRWDWLSCFGRLWNNEVVLLWVQWSFKIYTRKLISSLRDVTVTCTQIRGCH